MKDMIKRLRGLSLQVHRTVSTVAILASGIIGWICTQFDAIFGVVLCAIVLVGSIAWDIVFVRCPHCGHHFNPRALIPNFCPECGEKL